MKVTVTGTCRYTGVYNGVNYDTIHVYCIAPTIDNPKFKTIHGGLRPVTFGGKPLKTSYDKFVTLFGTSDPVDIYDANFDITSDRYGRILDVKPL